MSLRDQVNTEGLYPWGAPPTDAAATRVVDVLLVMTSDVGSFEEFEAHPPVGSPAFELAPALRVEKLGGDLERLVMDACTQRGHFFVPAMQYGCQYALTLDHPLSAASEWAWDPDGRLAAALALSRLVRDNAYSTEYAARVVAFADGQHQVIPFDGGESRQAYRMHDTRDWLDADDAAALAALIAAYESAGDDLVPRMRGALWRAEHVAREHYLDVVVPGLVAALEGLISSNHRQVTRQMVNRIPALAAELGVTGVSKRLVRKIYAARSQGAHGADIEFLKASPQSDVIRQVALMQAVLRATVRRGIEDPAFRAVFSGEQTIRTRWPVQVRHRFWRWRTTEI